MGQRLYVAGHPLGYIKIGRSYSGKARIQSLRSLYPGVTLEWEGPYILNEYSWKDRCFLEPAYAETTAQNLLNEHRVVGEWFTVSASTAIKACNRAVVMLRSGDRSLIRRPRHLRAGEIDAKLIALGIQRPW